MDWTVIFYETANGDCPIQEFIDSRSVREQAKIMAWIGQLQEKGPSLPRPFADLLRDGIHELRIKLTGSQVRVLYFFCFRSQIVLTHHFIKKTAKVPKAEINKAIKCMEDYRSRHKEREAR